MHVSECSSLDRAWHKVTRRLLTTRAVLEICLHVFQTAAGTDSIAIIENEALAVMMIAMVDTE